MNKPKRRKYPLGGQMEGGVDPVTGERLTPAQIKEKYKNNPYVTNGREGWGAMLDKTLPQSGGKVKVRDAVLNASKFSGVDAGLLYSSAAEEGLGYAINRPDDASEAYVSWSEKNPKLAGQFRVDGFYNYGLDTFGDQYAALAKKGYLPEGFDKKFTPFKAKNESGNTYQSAAFATDEDALIAKSAMIRSTQDALGTYATKKGLKLSDKQKEFFTLAGYNGGLGNLDKMLDSYNAKGYLKDDKFLDASFKPASYNDIYTNVQRRLQNRDVLKAEGFLKDGGKMRPEYQDGTTLDPITGQPVNNGLSNAKNMGQDVWSNAQTSQVPINPNAPKDQQIFRVDNKGDVVQQTQPIIPLSQFYDESIDRFGNTQLSGTGQYVNAQGQVNTVNDQQARNNEISNTNRIVAEENQKQKSDVEFAARTGISTINAFFNKKEQAQQDRTNLRKAIMQEVDNPIFNPYAEGTGSQAIMAGGGSLKGEGQGMNITDGGKAKQISGADSPMFEFQGNTHKEGGIGIEYGGKTAEVEKDEVGWVGDDGGLNIFGKMKVPGTNKTFKKAAKDMAKAELETDKKKAYYSVILGETNKTNKYQESARSTAKVMLDSLNKQSMEIEKDKQGLADYQNLVLALTGKDENVMAYGGKMPKRPEYAEGAKIDPNDPASIQKIIDKYSGGKSPLKAADFIEVAQKYKVPLDLMLAQAIAESNIGTKGRAVRSKNIFNVGNTDDGSTEYQNSWKAGLERYAKLIKEEYATDPNNVTTQDILSNNFVRPKRGGRYATAAYTPQVMDILKEINPEANYTAPANLAANEPKGGFKLGTVTFSPKDAKSLYDFVNYDDEHPLNPKNQTSDEDKQNYKKLQEYLGLGGPGDEFNQFKGKDGKQYNSPKGLKPSIFYKDPSIVEALRKDQTFPKAAGDKNWGPEHDKLWNSLTKEKQQELLTSSSSQPTGNTISTTNTTATDFKPKYEQIQTIDPTKETQYGAAYKDPTTFKDKVNIGTGDRSRGWISPLAIEQIAPELLTMGTNKRQAVPQLSYQPELKQTFDLSYQLGRNENQSSFNQAAKVAEQTGNVGAISDLAASLYKANESYNMQEVQGNAAQKLGVYGQNVDTLNDAKLKNLQFIDAQQTKQAAADFNTRKEDITAFTSIAGKVLQNRLENKTYNAYANLFRHYGFDSKGNVTFNPDDVTQRFNEGEAQQFGMLAAQKGVSDLMKQGTKTATTYDKDGNIKKVTSIDSDLEEFNSIWNSKNLDEAQKRRILSNRKNPIYDDLKEN